MVAAARRRAGWEMAEPLRGLVFDVQRFSVHDGPGLRTVAFLKGCPLRCSWCQNPESLRYEPELSVVAERCIGCGQCVQVCSRGALLQGACRVDRSHCVGCGDCVAGCPAEARHVAGRRVTVDELTGELVADRSFFDVSGGGVTLSGGEPTAQPAFCAALVGALTSLGISVGLETCGLFRWAVVEPWIREVDFIYVDLKLMDSARHRLHTGAGNERILDNARTMVELGLPVHFRVPVIPGINDDAPNLDAVGRFVAGFGLRTVTLLRYHTMGEAKIARVASPLVALGIDASASAGPSLQRARERLGSAGLEVMT